MKHILSIAFALNGKNFEQIISFNNENVKLTQFSTNFDISLTEEIIKKYDGIVDAIALSGLPPEISFSGGRFLHPTAHYLKSLSKETPTLDGQLFKDVYLPWAFRYFYLENADILNKKQISFYCGGMHKNILDVLEEFDNSIILADLYFLLKIPKVLRSSKSVDRLIKVFSSLMRKFQLKRTNYSHFDSNGIVEHALDDFFKSDFFVGNFTTLNLINLKHLKGKKVIIDFLSTEIEEKLSKAGVTEVVSCLPDLGIGDFVNYSIFESLLLIFGEDKHILNENHILDWIDKLSLRPHLKTLNKNYSDDKVKFAFIIHPLSTKYLFYHPQLKFFKKYSTYLEKIAENLISFSPGFFYGKINGIKSEKNGKEVEGLIYTVTETPKKLLDKDSETIYRKLISLSGQAKISGAKLIGLGAYTKIVGDAGLTVAKRSPIPVTTGNSLSAASTIWAAKYAVDKLGLTQKVNGFYDGTAMVIGATGSIGAVTAKLLSKKWKNIVIVAPRAYKLLELKKIISEISPKCNISLATDPNDYLKDCDLLITTTSAQGKKILDIKQVKPGCIICDVSRPFDISEDDAAQRPDVMVIASGEVILPGDVNININLGLEGNVVYACLAETALLAMEGRYESFTLSRNISYEKVLEIDRLATEHGVRLSAIMGHGGVISEEEFDLCRIHAKKALENG